MLEKETLYLIMVPFDGYNGNIVFCTDSLYGRVYYRNPAYKADRYLYGIAQMDDIYISLLSVQCQNDKLLALEHLTMY